MSTAKMSKAESLKRLGDPSGHQDSKYWDEWFQIVCKDERGKEKSNSFEWYCSAEEVMRLIGHYITEDDADQTMIHPGSGNSMLPFLLGEKYPKSRQIIMDVSEVALDLAKSLQPSTCNEDCIEFVAANVLQPPLPDLADGSCHVWTEKGFFDGIFSKGDEKETKQAKDLFQEAYRLLNTAAFGHGARRSSIMVIVSLAEDHSLRLIVENYMSSYGKDRRTVENAPSWFGELHIWELMPLSGEMLVFGFVLVIPGNDKSKSRIMWRDMSGGEADVAYELTADSETAYEEVRRRVEEARKRFAANQTMAVPSGEKEDVMKVLATIDIKPFDASTDMEKLGERLVSIRWDGTDVGDEEFRPVWHPFDESSCKNKCMRVVPVAFGISKLQLRFVLETARLDDFVEAISEWEGEEGGFEDGVQSVDVDWENTIPVSSASKIISAKV